MSLYAGGAPNDTICPPEAVTRKNWYAVATSPCTGVFDGIVKVQEPIDPKTKYDQVITDRLPDSTRLVLTIESADTLAGSVNIRIRAITTDSIIGGNPRLFAMIIQDSMKYGMTGDSLFSYVCRRIIPPDTTVIGIPFAHTVPNDTFDTTLTVTNLWHASNLGVLTFIQDISSKKVIQAVMKRRLY